MSDAVAVTALAGAAAAAVAMFPAVVAKWRGVRKNVELRDASRGGGRWAEGGAAAAEEKEEWVGQPVKEGNDGARLVGDDIDVSPIMPSKMEVNSGRAEEGAVEERGGQLVQDADDDISDPPQLVDEENESMQMPSRMEEDHIIVAQNDIDGCHHEENVLCDAFSALDIAGTKSSHAIRTSMAEEEEEDSLWATPEKKVRPSIQDGTDRSRLNDETSLCDALSALGISDADRGWASWASGAHLTEAHRSLPREGGHVHALLACWPGRLLDEAEACGGNGGADGGIISYKVIEALAGADNRRGDEATALEGWQEVFLTKKRDRLRKKPAAKLLAAVKSADAAGRERLLDYLQHGECTLGGAVEGPWYAARSLSHWPLWPADESQINAADVCQGDIDDCYFACGLSLAAEHYPGCLRERIIRIEDGESGRSCFVVQHWPERLGSCNSRSPLAKEGPIKTEVEDVFYVHRRVNRKGAPGTPIYCRSRSGALYAMVFERAWLKFRSPGDCGSYEDIANEKCLEAEAVLHFLTGLKFLQMNLAQYRQEVIWNVICSALQDGRAISTGTYPKGSGRTRSSGKKTKRSEEWTNLFILPKHNYALLDAGEDASYGRFLVLRNPHGKELSPFLLPAVPAWPAGANSTEDGPELGEDGVFRLSLSEFFSYFETISYAKETHNHYPVTRCHRYRRFFANLENILWCNETALGKHDDDGKSVTPRKLNFQDTH